MKKLTITAKFCIREITLFIAQDNEKRGLEYARLTEELFFNLPEFVTYKRASESLPKAVQEMPVKGFKGYTLRIMHHSDGVTYLLSAHRPGLTDGMKNRQTRDGLKEV
jgi:hypothetical protein